ncbi:MAG: serine protease [Thalassobaculaceae bacterium]|nr:serine protease [Thalassobaculaceae bacterium]
MFRLDNSRLGLLSVLGVVLVALVSSLLDAPPPVRQVGDVSVRRPPPAAAPPVADLEGVPEFSVEVGAKRDSSGTAFAIGDGVWMTARHVVDGCDAVGVLEKPGRAIRAKGVAIHRNADVAVMRVARSGPPVRFSDEVPRPGDIAYHVGFPRGEPGEMRSRMLGVRVMNVHGRYSTREPVIAWAELERHPEESRPLSGLSGGAVFDGLGRIIGVHVAGSKRRGRSFTAHPASIHDMVERSGVSASESGPLHPFTPETFVDVADGLRRWGTVVKALCDVR